MGPRAGLDGRKISPHRNSIPDRPTRSSVAIPTELPGPHLMVYIKPKLKSISWFQTIMNTKNLTNQTYFKFI